MIPAPGPDPSRPPGIIAALPQRIEWPALRPRGLDFFLGLVGIMASWIPARDPGFANLPEWYGVGLVAGSAIVGYVFVVGLVMLGRALIATIRRSLRYGSLYAHAEAVHSEIVRQQLDNRRLSQAVSFLATIVGEATFEISDVSVIGDEIEVMLALNDAVTPKSGHLLLVMDKRGGLPMGYLRVTAVTTTTIRARLENAESVWSAHIHTIVRQHVPFETTAIAVLIDYDESGETP